MKDNYKLKFIILTIICSILFISSFVSKVLIVAYIDLVVWFVGSMYLAFKKVQFNKRQEEITHELYKDIQQRKNKR